MNTFQVIHPDAVSANREFLAQKITVLDSGNNAVNFISYQMQRFGNPTGNINLTIQGVTTDRGVTIPDGIVLDTATPVAASTLSDTALSGIIFFFPSNPVLVTAQDYFLVLEVEYDFGDIPNRIIVGHKNTFLSNGQLYHFGEGLGNDWQDAPGDVDANQWHAQPPFVSADISWDMPQFFTGVTYSTPDLTALVQAQVDDPGYTPDAGIILGVTRTQTDPNFNRIWRSNQFLGNADGPVLNVKWKQRRVMLT